MKIKNQKSKIKAVFLCGLVILGATGASMAQTSFARAPGIMVQIKDIARIAGLESIDLIGYGVVIGLSGSGDKDIELTKQTMANLIENFNVKIDVDDISSKNVAAVIVTAKAPPFHKEGDRIDVVVSSLGDATSLEGGVLLMTPLMDPNAEIYALAQGSLTVGGFSAGVAARGGMTVGKNVTTTGIVPSGAKLKHSQSLNFTQSGILQLILRNPDFTTADRMASAINKEFGYIAIADDASIISVAIPEDKMDMGESAMFMAQLEKLTLTPDSQSKIVVNERTGTIVMGGNVHISEAVIAHGNLTVTIKENLHPSQPIGLVMRGPQPGIRSLETPDFETDVEEENARVMVIPNTTTVHDLANVLHKMGATPRDLISILEALRQLGAIQMELVAM